MRPCQIHIHTQNTYIHKYIHTYIQRVCKSRVRLLRPCQSHIHTQIHTCIHTHTYTPRTYIHTTHTHKYIHTYRDCVNLERASSGLAKAIQLRMDSENRVVKMAEFSRVIAENLTVAIGGSYSPAVAALVLEQQIANITKSQVCWHVCMYVCIHTRSRTRAYTYIHTGSECDMAGPRPHTYIHIHVLTQKHTASECDVAGSRIHTYIFTCLHTYIHTGSECDMAGPRPWPAAYVQSQQRRIQRR
jgi:hypothetical protein